MKKIPIAIFRVVEMVLLPLTLVTAFWVKVLTRVGLHRAALSEKIFMLFGVLPVRDYYTEPLIDPKKHLMSSLRKDRDLPGIDFNVKMQLEILNQFNYTSELLSFPIEKPPGDHKIFFYNNPSYASGDAEYLYNIVRHFKPGKLVEIGSGNSTLIAIEAIKKNKEEHPTLKIEHICIEPYLQPWLERTNAQIIRKKVEDMDKELFRSLKKNDILFIDSSHIIRPQGDVLFEYLEILPTLQSGVLVHIHDIFTPKDYLDDWIFKEHLLWNEQYLLEAFLTMNNHYEIIGAMNFLAHNHRTELSAKCPIFAKQQSREPGAIWIRRK